MNTSNLKPKRNWCCDRCKTPIDILVADKDRKYIIDGGDIYCSNTCKVNKFTPIDLKRAPVKKGKTRKQKLENQKSKFKCFNCGRIYHFMTWNKRCCDCEDNGVNDGSERLMKL